MFAPDAGLRLLGGLQGGVGHYDQRRAKLELELDDTLSQINDSEEGEYEDALWRFSETTEPTGPPLLSNRR
jgi:hypothetical protein